MKYWLLYIILIGLISCEKKVAYDDEYKYSICLKVLEKTFLADSNETFIINPEIKDFRFNDVYILMYPERKQTYREYKNEHLKEMGLSLKAYEDALYLITSNSFDLNKLQKHSLSKNVVRLSYIRNNLIFMDVITYCDELTVKSLKNVNENDEPIFSITSFIIKIDDLGNAVYKVYNGLSFIVACH
ncbi:hypothetical protein FNJ87_08735 [Nonlabens mediterrranea]|uniref:Lipoprotein n=1 Tax=Nonlabens mediterrranea TaxID=1419947 RepID=A0ABS0A4X8_9FLAO|nr:hypothetical protein [Nonlabens mediterrranea]